MVNKLSPGYNLRWESSRMMLPEHVAALQHQKAENKKIPKPLLDEQALNEIGIVIMDSLRYTLDIKITYWLDGYFKEVIGTVSKVDMQLKQIKIESEDDYLFLFIDNIIASERI